MVKLLLGHNANAFRETTDPRCRRTRSLLHELANKPADSLKYGPVVGILFEMTSVDPNWIDKNGDTALSWAVSMDKFEVTKALLKHPKIDPNIADDDGRSALHFLADPRVKVGGQGDLKLIKERFEKVGRHKPKKKSTKKSPGS